MYSFQQPPQGISRDASSKSPILGQHSFGPLQGKQEFGKFSPQSSGKQQKGKMQQFKR
jgi:hypothetical protein